MRNVMITIAGFALAGASLCTQARDIRPDDRYMCSWGAGTASRAQELKLSGVSRYAAAQKIQGLSFSKSWMRSMALGITEQTFDSTSRAKPGVVRDTFYDGCIRYRLARKEPVKPAPRQATGHLPAQPYVAGTHAQRH
jgi:hypothetical protein